MVYNTVSGRRNNLPLPQDIQHPKLFIRRPTLRLQLGYLLFILLLKLLNRFIPIILHHPFLLEIFHPSLGTNRLKLRQLLPAFPSCLLIILHGVEDVVVIQAVEEQVPAFVAPLPRRSVRCDTPAVGGLGTVGTGGGPREPAHF